MRGLMRRTLSVDLMLVFIGIVQKTRTVLKRWLVITGTRDERLAYLALGISLMRREKSRIHEKDNVIWHFVTFNACL